MPSGEKPSLRRRQMLKWMALTPTLPIAHSLRGADASPNHPDDAPRDMAPDWDLLLNTEEIKCLNVLCTIILPGDSHSPSAAEIGVVAFLNEWISAPYPEFQQDRITLRGGLIWLDAECRRRYQRSFIDLTADQQKILCDDIKGTNEKKPHLQMGVRFFARLRELVCSGFYTSPEGRRDLSYQGNVALKQFDGPPAEVLQELEARLSQLGL